MLLDNHTCLGSSREGARTGQTREIAKEHCRRFAPAFLRLGAALNIGGTLRRMFRLPARVQTTTAPYKRGRVDHVVILDGTMSSLEPGLETNAGRFYKLLCEAAGSAQMSIRYEQGVQWHTWRDAVSVAEGRGINKQIRRSYGFIASRYRPGDRIFLVGFSRGAYAVRSLAGVIDQVGLLTAQNATVRNIRQVYRHYEQAPESDTARHFAEQYCHEPVEIEMVGVWDTVKALGNRLPVFWRYSEPRFARIPANDCQVL